MKIVLNITNHEGDANENHSEIPSHPTLKGCYRKDRHDKEKGELTCTIGENVN
jgi:hypothetical protein